MTIAPNFTPTMLHYVPDTQLHIIPQLRTYLDGTNLPDPIDLRLSGHSVKRKPSGWFSPSIHPTMDLRQLVSYLVAPQDWVPPQFPDDTRISMIMGTIYHEVFNIAFHDMGIAVAPEEKTCPLCHRPRGRKPGLDSCNEHAVIDTALKRRGHIDDVVNLPRLGTIAVDVKTCAHYAIKSIANHDTSIFTKPDATALKRKYYGQGQEYLDLYGGDKFLFLFVGLGFPWELREIVIERDQPYIDAVKAKYAKALELAADYRKTGDLGPACCTGNNKKILAACPATACPVRKP